MQVIISGYSSPDVLTDDGIVNYARAIGLLVLFSSDAAQLQLTVISHPNISLRSSTECLGIHLGDPQSANLGDGNGWVNQTAELREDYGHSHVGTCLESAIGGNHFRCVFSEPNSTGSGRALLS